MLTGNDCNNLRDLIFAKKFQAGTAGSQQRAFRYLAVEPGGIGDSDATVHFSYSPPVWERAGHDSTPNAAISFLEAAIDETPYKGKQLAVTYHDHLRLGWPIAWGITAKDSFDNFPVLVLLEKEDGSVVGVLMRDSHSSGNIEARLANAYAEPHEVDELIEELKALAADEQFLGWYKESNIVADSLDAAVALTPETDAGQKHLLVYRENEWLHGLWNNPAKPDAFPMQLSSVADFYGTRVSAVKRRSRDDLDIAKSNQTVPGDYAVLDHVLSLLPDEDGDGKLDYEAIPAIKTLSDWWNTTAPEAMRSAALFRVYVWNQHRRIFVAGDPEEPAVQSDMLAKTPTYAIFEHDEKPTVALVFYRGRVFNKEDACGTQTYYADGKEAWQIGADLAEVNEAYYSLKGLRALHLRHAFND